MKTKLIAALSILTLITVPLLAACAPAPATTVPPTTAPVAAPPTAVAPTAVPPTVAPTKAPTAAPISLKIGYGGPPVASVDPTDFSGGAPPCIFEALVGFDKNEKMVGVLADSWQFLDDGKTLEFKLKKDIVFSSGDPFTAADVEFSLGRHLKKDMPIMAQLTKDTFDKLEIVDPYTIRFHFPKVNVQFLPQTAPNMFIVSKAAYDKVGEDGYLKAPVGTGPYKIVGWKEGQYIDVAYNEKYRGAKPQVQSARFLAAPDGATRVAMLKAGEVDMITQTPWTNVADLQAKGFNRADVPQPHDIALQFDLLDKSVPWYDVKVRQAINYAIDKDALNKKLFGGVPQEGVWLESWELGYDPSLKPAYAYDLAKAKQLMKDAGKADGFTMPIVYASFMEWGADLADYVSNALAQINIKVQLTGLSTFPEFMGTVEDLHKLKGKPVVLLFDYGWPGNPEPVINLTNGFWMGKGNTLYDNKDVSALIEQGLQTVDNTARGKLISQAYTTINNDLPFVPICLEVATSMMKSNITYTKSSGGMNTGPANLNDLTVK
jgi:peptide/nickel transport system substrate-binding protein